MNELMNVGASSEITMNSREIAELTGKQHRNVTVDIEKMLSDLNLPTAEFSAVYKADNNQEYRCFNLPKRETLILVSGYSIELRARIIDRWQELEQKQQHQFQLPDFTNPAEAAIAWAEQWQKRELAEQSVLRLEEKIEQDAPKLSVYEAIAEANSGIRITEFARTISDKHSIGRNKLYSTLRDWKLLDRNNVPYQRCIEAGWFYVVERPFNKGDYSGINFQIFLTGKGQSYIINRLKKESII